MNLSLARYFSVLFLFLLCSLLPCFGQRASAYLKAAAEAMSDEDYYTALHHYSQAFEQNPATETAYKMGDAARLFKAYGAANGYYQTVLASAEKADYPNLSFYLGYCLKSLGNCEEALPFLSQYANQRTAQPDLAAQAQALVRACNWMNEQMEDSLLIVNRLYKRINTPYAEFAPYKSGDTLYYSSYQFDLEDDDYAPGRKIAKVMMSTDLRRGRPLGRSFNSDTSHTAHTVLSQDRQSVFFTKCSFISGAKIRCDLCMRTKDRRRRWKADFERLPSPINLPNYTNTQPNLFWDSLSQQEILLFVSNRPGGSGGYDIWQVPIPEDGASWTDPMPLSEINTSADEMTPYFDASAQILFFGSNRQPGYGGFDVYESTKVGEWSIPKVLPQPINSSYDDLYFFTTDGGQKGFLSSNRPGGQFLDKWTETCCPDIFSFVRQIPEIDTTTTDEVVTAVIPTVETTPSLPPLPKTLEEFLPLALYFDNDEPDARTRRQTTRKTYGDSYEQYSDREATYFEQFEDDDLEAVEQFFNNEVHRGHEKLERFSSILFVLLDEGQNVEIFLKGFTSPRAKSDYNLLLGKRRVSSVRNHFFSWNDGVLEPFIESGQLVLSEVSFGETRAAAAALDEKAGERLSIYSPEAARERRVEIVEIRRE